jgi:hypothetical protein
MTISLLAMDAWVKCANKSFVTYFAAFLFFKLECYISSINLRKYEEPGGMTQTLNAMRFEFSDIKV